MWACRLQELGRVKDHMAEVNVRSESLAAQVSTLESRVQTRESELAGSRREMDALKKEYQVSRLIGGLPV